MTTDPHATHLADQADAAADDARAQVLAMAVTGLGPGEWSTVATVAAPRWLLDAVDRHNHLVAVGQGRACPHRTGHTRTAVINLALWMPGYIACTPCVADGAFDTGPDEAHRCDQCGAGDPPILLCFYQGNNVVIHYGQCRACARQ